MTDEEREEIRRETLYQAAIILRHNGADKMNINAIPTYFAGSGWWDAGCYLDGLIGDDDWVKDRFMKDKA